MATIEVRPKEPKEEAAVPARRDRKRPPGAPPPRWRERLVPKTVIGITMLVLAAAIGAAFSGVVLYSYYEYRLNKTEAEVKTALGGINQAETQARTNINNASENAKAEIAREIEPIKKIRAEGE